MHKAFYILSLNYSINRGMQAFRRYETSKTIEQDGDEVFSTAQEGINYAAAVSRFLWPTERSKYGKEVGKLHYERGASLRRLLGIDSENPLNNRNLRNAFEHFDERLDMFLLEETSGCFFPQAILNSHDLADEPIGKIFKLIDTDKDCIVIFNEKFFFREIIYALQNLENTLSNSNIS